MGPTLAGATAFALWLALATAAGADELVLSGGGRVEGIVTAETPASLEVQTAEGVFITLERSGVAQLRLSDETGRQEIRVRWHAEREALEEEARRAEDLERSQREKGLIWQNGRWMTPEELDAWELEERQIEAAKEEESRARTARTVETREPAAACCGLVRMVLPVRRDPAKDKDDAPPPSLYLEVTTRIFNHLHTAPPALARAGRPR